MGIYSEYLEKNMDFDSLVKERKKQLKEISTLRERPIIVFASDLTETKAPISIEYSDLMPIKDQIETIKKMDETNSSIDLILETPGGAGEVSEDIVLLLRNHFSNVSIIIPGSAKSAGTIISMSADEILMEPSSSLGPIDAQLIVQGKIFSADAFLNRFEKIKKEVEDTGKLNKAYIPLLQGISIGEIENAKNAKEFAVSLVTGWLEKYKFKNWNEHSKSKEPVTHEQKKERARNIANGLSDHSKWLTHGRSIKIKDLEKMKLQITNYSKDTPLKDAITKYYTLMRITFDTTNMYKIFETPHSQIYRFRALANIPAPIPSNFPIPALSPNQPSGDFILIEANCAKCNTLTKIQVNFAQNLSINKGCVRFPNNDIFVCPKCKMSSNISDLRSQIEAQTKKKVCN